MDRWPEDWWAWLIIIAMLTYLVGHVVVAITLGQI